MSDDELEHLRAILAKTHGKPESAGIDWQNIACSEGTLWSPEEPNLLRVERK
jgi:hypothetical protein